MLRIIVFDGPTTIKLRLEGSLNAQTAPLLTERWAEVRSRIKERKAILDLGDVIEVDEEGRRALTWLSRAGVRLGHAHPKIRSVVEDVACDVPGVSHFTATIWRRFHLTDCSERWDAPYRLCRFICAILPPAWRPCGCRAN